MSRAGVGYAGPPPFSGLLAWVFCPEKPRSRGKEWSKFSPWCGVRARTRATSFCIGVTSGDTSNWTVKHRVQMDTGFKAHLSHVLTAQGSAWWCLHLLVNLQSHRHGIHLITVNHLLGASHGNSPESSRLGCPFPLSLAKRGCLYPQLYHSFVTCIFEIVSPPPGSVSCFIKWS